MPNGYRKFRTADKFGKTRRKRGVKKKETSLPSTETTAGYGARSDSVTATESAAPSDALVVDSAPAAVQDKGADGAARRTRLDSIPSADRAFREQQSQQKLSELSSVSATERKLKCVLSDGANSAPSESAQSSSAT
ncbi:hypothetical protein HPB50_025201 [Hyalomma asiaticum]|uniref:Uncharacterized protein n=1 Tax=Hyalomma asiaticum TaxID=266040 RepID=A0ACB7S5Q6_HYAAI|nr:hypothetical protein HPB50_025201 [Hyalomma asiaticum]